MRRGRANAEGASEPRLNGRGYKCEATDFTGSCTQPRMQREKIIAHGPSRLKVAA